MLSDAQIRLLERHSCELLLALHEIEQRTTRIPSPRTNGFV